MAKKKTTLEKSIQELLDELRRHKKDNWSPEVQIAILSDQISVLQSHIEKNKHDVDAKRSLLRKVAKRRSFLRYLKDNNMERYISVTELLSLKV